MNNITDDLVDKIKKWTTVAPGRNFSTLADLVGVHRSTISNWVTGKRQNIRYNHMQKLLSILGADRKVDDTVKGIVSDEELYKAFAHANYGDMSPRDVVRLGLLKTACGFSHGYTSTQILLELGLIVEKTRKAGREMLTDRGRRYLWHAWSEGEPF